MSVVLNDNNVFFKHCKKIWTNNHFLSTFSDEPRWAYFCIKETWTVPFPRLKVISKNAHFSTRWRWIWSPPAPPWSTGSSPCFCQLWENYKNCVITWFFPHLFLLKLFEKNNLKLVDIRKVLLAKTSATNREYNLSPLDGKQQDSLKLFIVQIILPPAFGKLGEKLKLFWTGFYMLTFKTIQFPIWKACLH